ncbi:MAG TPA: class I SAM-dependent methyltransferase [Azospirillum sp.]
MTPREMERWLSPDWRAKLEAWWEGYDLGNLQRQARTLRSIRDHRPGMRPRDTAAAFAAAAPAPAAVPANAPADEYTEARGLECLQLDRSGWPLWSVERVQGAEMIWGDEFVGPGDGEWMVDVVRPFGLGPSNSVLDLAAGLGGATRAVASAFDTWVTGLDPSPVLANLAMARSKLLGLDRKAPVLNYDPERFQPSGTYDLVLADRIAHRVRDKESFVDNLCACVKPKGGVLMMDYAFDDAPASPDAVAHWRRTEPQEVYPWTVQRMKEELTQRNMDVRIAEDLTAVLRRQIVARVRRLAAALQTTPNPAPALLAALSRELSLWWARLRVLGQGLGFYRFVAYKPA